MTATAIVVTHNSAGQLGESLDALCAAGVAVRVVDNASADGTVALLNRDYPGVWLAANPVNVGFAAAVNQALAGLVADVVLLVNPDCVVPAATVRGLIEHLRRHPSVGVAGPRLIGSDGEAAMSAHPFETLWSVLASRFGGGLLPVGIRRWLGGRARRRSYEACLGTHPAQLEPLQVDWLSGACLAVRGVLLHELGGLDERYFMYYEDEELCLHAWHRSYQVELLPQLWAEHAGGASSGPGTTWPHLYRSMLIFFGDHRRSSYQLVRAAVIVRALLGMGLAQLRRLVGRPHALARLGSWREVASLALAARQPPGAEFEPGPAAQAESPAAASEFEPGPAAPAEGWAAETGPEQWSALAGSTVQLAPEQLDSRPVQLALAARREVPCEY